MIPLSIGVQLSQTPGTVTTITLPLGTVAVRLWDNDQGLAVALDGWAVPRGWQTVSVPDDQRMHTLDLVSTVPHRDVIVGALGE